MAILYPIRVIPRVCLLAVVAASTAYLSAQTVVTGPQSSYLFDSASGNIRRMVGRPGSAFLGDPVLTGLRTASIGPNGITALAIWDDRVEWISDLGDYAGTRLVLDAAAPGPDRFFWSSDSSTAALFSSQGATLQFVQRTPGSPALVTNVDLTGLAAHPSILAVDVSRSKAAVLSTTGLRRGETQSLFLVQPGLSPQAVRTADEPVAAGFAENGALYIAGRRLTVSLLQDPATQTNADLLFREADGSGTAAAVLARSNSGLLYLADATLQRVRIYDFQSLTKVDELQMAGHPTQFQPFLANSFLLNTRTGSGEPILLLQTAPKNAVVFIPAGE